MCHALKAEAENIPLSREPASDTPARLCLPRKNKDDGITKVEKVG